MAYFGVEVERNVHPDIYDPPARHQFPNFQAAVKFAKRESKTPTAVCARVYDSRGRRVKTYTVERKQKRVLKRRVNG